MFSANICMSGGSNKGTNKSTNKSASVRKKERLLDDILVELKAANNPLSTSDLCVKVDKAWHTVDRACMFLQLGGRVDGFKIGNMNIWKIKEVKK